MAQPELDLDGLGRPLSHVVFTVVDLETTGFAADAAAITEIGAVKVRGGEVLGEFSTLVNPGEPIGPRISSLTGITDAMVADAPSVSAVLPSFLEFASGTVLVAHNAAFDVGFLRSACNSNGMQWPRPQVVDTVTLARRLLDRSEVPNKRLSTLARYFGARTTPRHRALDDARATVDVLHGLLERLGGHDVHTDVELNDFQRAIPAAEQRRKRHLAQGLPSGPGVYVFRDADGDTLYVGVSGDVATRVRSYFSGSERRARMRDMLRQAESVEAVECAHLLEAQVRELRLIGGAKPRYNRRFASSRPLSWLRLTSEPYPRLSLARKPPEPDVSWLGPFTSKRAAAAAMEAVHDALPLRQCTSKLSPHRPSAACALEELGCPAPCRLRISTSDYAALTEVFAAAVAGDPAPIAEPLLRRIDELAAAQRYEAAADVRGRLRAFLRAVSDTQRRSSLIHIPELVAAGPASAGGWEFAVIRHGQLAAAGVSPPRTDPMPIVDSLVSAAATVPATAENLAGSRWSETEVIHRWLEDPKVRLVRSTAGWSSPLPSAARYTPLLQRLSEADTAAANLRHSTR